MKDKGKRKGPRDQASRTHGGVGPQIDTPLEPQLHPAPKRKKKTLQSPRPQKNRKTVKADKSGAPVKHAVYKEQRRKFEQEKRRRRLIQQGVITQRNRKDYDPKIAGQILERHANGEPIVSILATPHFPSTGQFYRWIEDIPTLKTLWEQARRARAHLLAEETVLISDASVHGHPALIPGHALRVRARQWFAGKLQPTIYGDKVDLQHSGHLSIAALSQSLKTVTPPELTVQGRTLTEDGDDA